MLTLVYVAIMAQPSPHALAMEARAGGDPLAPYVELRRHEADYQEPHELRAFHDVMATCLSFLGDVEGATEAWAEIAYPKRARGPLLNSSLDDYRPVDAVDLIVERAASHNVIMIGEEHVQPQTRCILEPLLERLWDEGYRYLAAETFNDDLEATLDGGYTRLDTGFYTMDPVFANAVNTAIERGYTLVPYECRTRVESPPDDPMRGQNHRERTQARHLKERIFDVDPDAKVIVWAGRSHVSEETGEVPGGAILEPMAYQFKELTGIDPFSVYLPAGVAQHTPEFEFSFYRYATHHGLVDGPTIFVDDDGRTFGISGDAVVLFPRPRSIKGRPDWLVTELGRRMVEIPTEVIFPESDQVVQAFGVGDLEHAVPADQVLISPGDPVPVLMLSPGERYRVRTINDAGDVRGPVDVDVPR